MESKWSRIRKRILKLSVPVSLLVGFYCVSPATRAAETATPESGNIFGPSPVLVTGGSSRYPNSVKLNTCSSASNYKLVEVSSEVSRYLRTGAKKRGAEPQSPKKSCGPDIDMNKGLVDFMNNNMQRCVQEGWSAHIATRPNISDFPVSNSPVRIFHEGCIGDANHQHTPSWHNHLLAIDISGIEVGGTPLWFMNKDNHAFFKAFRECWGDAVKAFNPSCSKQPGRSAARKNMPAGTIGKEDPRHQNHMHISLPCTHLLKSKQKMNMAKVDL